MARGAHGGLGADDLELGFHGFFEEFSDLSTVDLAHGGAHIFAHAGSAHEGIVLGVEAGERFAAEAAGSGGELFGAGDA